MSLKKPEYVSDLIVYLLNGLGVDYVPLNPGATTRAIHESVVNFGGNRAPELITCCHEEIAVTMAEGYYLATGKPQVALLHDIVGLQHGTKPIYEAYLRNIPTIIVGGTGPMNAAHRRPWIDWIHTAHLQAQVVRDYVKWDDQPEGAQSVVESILRAYQIAMTEPKGPVYLCFDVELQESRLPQNFALPDLSRYRAPAPPAGNAADVAAAAKALLQGERPVLMVQDLGRTPGGAEAVQSLAELLGLPVITLGEGFSLANRHPLNVTGANAQLLEQADLVLAVDVKQLEAALTRPARTEGTAASAPQSEAAGHGRTYESLVSDHAKIIQVGLESYSTRAWTSSCGRLVPADLRILGSGAQVLGDLVRYCTEGIDGTLQERASERSASISAIHQSLRETSQERLREKLWEQRPSSTGRLAAEVWQAIKDEDWLLVHGSLSGWERRLWDVTERSRWIAAGGGTGTGMGLAMGAALAHRDSGKLCVSLQKDGDLLYSSSSLWTAAHHNIPMLVVMFNNKSYYQDAGHQMAVAKERNRSLDTANIGIGLEEPDTDFAMLARSFGLYGEGPVEDPDEIQAALKRGIEVVKEEHRTALINTITQPR